MGRRFRRHLRAKLLVEAANGPTTYKATEILTERGIIIVRTYWRAQAALWFRILNGFKTIRAITGERNRSIRSCKRS